MDGHRPRDPFEPAADLDLAAAYRRWCGLPDRDRETYRTRARTVSPSLAACDADSWMLTQRCLRLLAADLAAGQEPEAPFLEE